MACLLAGILLCACESVPKTSVAPTPTRSPAWQTYIDKQYGFSISYPPDFTFEAQGSGPRGGLQLYRAVQSSYQAGYPPGQVELGVFTMESDSLTNWITKHTGITTSSDQAFYWQSTSRWVNTTAARRPAIAFDWSSSGEGPTTVHATIFLKDESKVILFDWWSTDAAYAPSVESTAGAMLATFSG
jgi:hypothetical protein